MSPKLFISSNIYELNVILSSWLIEYLSVRPHTSLNYLTPLQFLDSLYPDLSTITSSRKRPSQRSENELEKSLAEILAAYISKGRKVGLSPEKEAELQEELRKLEQIDIQRWDNIIDFIRSNGKRPSQRSENELEKSLAVTLATYISKGLKVGLSPEKEEKLKQVLEELKQRK